MSDVKFRLDWYPGSSAEVELYDPRTGGEGIYQLRYTPPFRTTFRPPIGEINLGPSELVNIDQDLNELVTVIAARAGGPTPAGRGPAAAGGVLQKMQELGENLYTLTIPPNYIRNDIREPGLFLEIGMDESLLAYPWELMHDGEDFLCLKHNVGRFINGTAQTLDLNRPPGLFSRPYNRLKVLLIVVPNPLPRGETQYDRLPEAEVESKEIANVLGNDPDSIQFDTLSGSEATHKNVTQHLKQGYQIVHFCGHANFNDVNPRASSLVLHDRDLSTNTIHGFLLRTPPAPVLCFINACETAKTASGREQFNVFGLARAFLETGTYLLGTRWKINDAAARYFAPKFYSSLLIDSKPLGWAIREARQTCKDSAPEDDFAWASYILYGDPRVIFRRSQD